MDERKARPWFDVAKGLHRHLGLSQKTATFYAGWMAAICAWFTNRRLPPQWLFQIGAAYVAVVEALDDVYNWLQLKFVRLEVWFLIRQKRMLENDEKEWIKMDSAQMAFEMRCGVWAQIANGAMYDVDISPTKCERLGKLTGKLVRYCRTFRADQLQSVYLADLAVMEVQKLLSGISTAGLDAIVEACLLGINATNIDSVAKNNLRRTLQWEVAKLRINMSIPSAKKDDVN